MTTLTLRPNADSAIELDRSAGAYNYAVIDESSEDTGDYVSVDVTDGEHEDEHHDHYGLPDHSSESGTINSITIKARAKYATSAGDNCLGKIKLGVKIGSTDYWGTQENLTTSNATYSKQYTTNPADSAAWEWSDIDDLIASLHLYAHEDDHDYGKGGVGGNCTSYCYQLWVEVDYTPPAAGSAPAPNLTQKLLAAGLI